MSINLIPILILGFYGLIILGSVALLIWAINNRLKEKKREKIKHKDYDKY